MEQSERKIYSLKQLNLSLEKFIMNHFGSKQFWVTAEITKVTGKSGHKYIELADSDAGKLNAQTSAYMWATNYRSIEERIGSELYDILKPGNNALFLIKIEFHSIFGLKLNILDIDPTYTYGDIERKKQETIRLLKQEGLFLQQKSIYLPTIAKRIAVIGSPETSGYRDFMNELRHNTVYTNFVVKTFPASVQGQKASSEIIQALRDARQYNIDVIVIIRGGGSKMDLNIFNDYALCREICLTKIPILTGIGHETDEVVADLVSRLNCITPTAAAKHLYIQIAVYSGELRAALDGLIKQSLAQLGYAKDEFAHLSNYFFHHSQKLVADYRTKLEQKAHQFHRLVHYLLSINHQDLELYLHKSQSAAIHKIRLSRDIETPAFIDKIHLMGLNLIDQSRVEIKNLEHLLAIINPEKLLNAGYTISTIDNQDVFNIAIDLIGKEMKTLTAHSLITSTITHQEKLKQE
jgi:exodeoxyribonuclease VII large subunit